MNRILKIGLIGFSATIALAILLKLFGVALDYILPCTLPWAMMIIVGVTKRKKQN